MRKEKGIRWVNQEDCEFLAFRQILRQSAAETPGAAESNDPVAISKFRTDPLSLMRTANKPSLLRFPKTS